MSGPQPGEPGLLVGVLSAQDKGQLLLSPIKGAAPADQGGAGPSRAAPGKGSAPSPGRGLISVGGLTPDPGGATG